MSRSALRSLTTAAAALGAIASLSACSFSASLGGSEHSGDELATTVTDTLAGEYPGSVFEGITCDDTPTIAAGETTACHGTADGAPMDFTVTWQDDEGSFAVDAVAA